jgi:nucleotidyltransferase substrate binding protein (TIGR01987 family)
MDSRNLLSDFSRAVIQLGSALELSAENDVIKAGCIQYFEFSFELAWKTIKRLAEEDGMGECNSPKSALKAAFANGWIDDEEIWLDMLMSRNKMAHTYNSASALTIFEKLQDYLNALMHLQTKLNSLN